MSKMIAISENRACQAHVALTRQCVVTPTILTRMPVGVVMSQEAKNKVANLINDTSGMVFIPGKPNTALLPVGFDVETDIVVSASATEHTIAFGTYSFDALINTYNALKTFTTLIGVLPEPSAIRLPYEVDFLGNLGWFPSPAEQMYDDGVTTDQSTQTALRWFMDAEATPLLHPSGPGNKWTGYTYNHGEVYVNACVTAHADVNGVHKIVPFTEIPRKRGVVKVDSQELRARAGIYVSLPHAFNRPTFVFVEPPAALVNGSTPTQLATSLAEARQALLDWREEVLDDVVTAYAEWLDHDEFVTMDSYDVFYGKSDSNRPSKHLGTGFNEWSVAPKFDVTPYRNQRPNAIAVYGSGTDLGLSAAHYVPNEFREKVESTYARRDEEVLLSYAVQSGLLVGQAVEDIVSLLIPDYEWRLRGTVDELTISTEEAFDTFIALMNPAVMKSSRQFVFAPSIIVPPTNLQAERQIIVDKHFDQLIVEINQLDLGDRLPDYPGSMRQSIRELCASLLLNGLATSLAAAIPNASAYIEQRADQIMTGLLDWEDTTAVDEAVADAAAQNMISIEGETNGLVILVPGPYVSECFKALGDTIAHRLHAAQFETILGDPDAFVVRKVRQGDFEQTVPTAGAELLLMSAAAMALPLVKSGAIYVSPVTGACLKSLVLSFAQHGVNVIVAGPSDEIAREIATARWKMWQRRGHGAHSIGTITAYTDASVALNSLMLTEHLEENKLLEGYVSCPRMQFDDMRTFIQSQLPALLP